jgi:hypothetical protein
MSLVRLSLILLLAGLGTTVARGQDQVPEAAEEAVPDTVVQRVSTAFRTGDARRLLSPAPDRVEVSLFGTRTFYSSAQAFYVLRDFFETHPPAGFDLADATVAGESCFLRGRLEHTRSERPHQVYVRLVRHEGETWRLHEVRIDVEAE